MSDSSGRSILLLGGSRHQVPAIEAARRLGLRTVLCDYLPDNPGRDVADVFYLKSTTDRELMLDVARAEGVSGVISFGSDAAAPSAAYVAERLGLPTNPLETIDTLSEKHLFRPFLLEHGFPCPRSGSLRSDATVGEALPALAGLTFPVVVKPTDASGSKGVSVVREPDPDELSRAIGRAAAFSRNGVLEVEEFIEYSFPHLIGGDIFVVDGEVRFWGLMSCLRDPALGGLVPVGKAFPSGLDPAAEREVRSEVQRLVSAVGFRFGEMNVEVIVGRDGVPYVLELGGRAGGNMIPLQLEDISGIDLVEASVRCAMGDFSMDVSFGSGGRCVATHVLHSRASGSFAGVDVSPLVEPHVYRTMLYVAEGDPVERLENGSQAIGLLFLEFSDEEQMWGILDRINDLVTVRVS